MEVLAVCAVAAAWIMADYFVRKAQLRAAVAETLGDHLHGKLVEERTGRHQDRVEYERRIDDLLRQAQSMAERIATLRQSGLPDGGDAQFTPTKPVIPFPLEMESFLQGLDSEEARLMTEEFIESERLRGVQDEQIMERIRKGEVTLG